MEKYGNMFVNHTDVTANSPIRFFLAYFDGCMSFTLASIGKQKRNKSLGTFRIARFADDRTLHQSSN